MKKILCVLICIFMAAFYFTVPVSAAVNPDYDNVIELIPLEITDFSYGSITGDYLENVRFTVSGGTGRYEYALAVGVLAADGSLEGSREFYQSSAALDEEVVVGCNLKNRLDSYGEYVLILNVWKFYGELEVNESAVADKTFSYINPNTPAAIEDFSVIVDVTDHTVYIDYADWAVRSAQTYLIAMDDGSPEVYFNTLYSDELGTAILFEEDAASLTIEVSYKDNNGRQSEIHTKTVEIIDFITFEVDDVTTNAQAKISYNTTKEIIVKVYVSKGHIFNSDVPSENYQEIKLSGSGFFSVNLYEFDNLISIEYDAGNNITIIKQAVVHRNSIAAPILILPEHTGVISTSMNTFDITGLTESGTAITINGLPISIEADGSFIYKAELLDGENVFEVTASDGAGNITAQNIVIRKNAESSGSSGGAANLIFDNIFLICSFLLALLFVLFMFIFRKRFNKTWKEDKFKAVINIFRNISTPFFVIAAAYLGYTGFRYGISNKTVNSKAFAENGLIDPNGMYDGILKNQINRDEFLVSVKLFTVIGAIFGICLVISILYSVIKKAVKQRKDTREDTAIAAKNKDAETKSPIADPEEYVCPNCGAKYTVPTKFCGKCGTKIK